MDNLEGDFIKLWTSERIFLIKIATFSFWVDLKLIHIKLLMEKGYTNFKRQVNIIINKTYILE